MGVGRDFWLSCRSWQRISEVAASMVSSSVKKDVVNYSWYPAKFSSLEKS